jgi:CRISPR-associated protein Csm5
MTDPVVSFPVHVSVLSPLHIGSGETVDPKWFIWNGKQVTLLDSEKLLARVVERQQVAQFEQFCLDARATAQDFLTAARIPVPDVVAYRLECPERPREILSFIKTGGRPYLPGSSLKGALRSSLLRAFFLENEGGVLGEATDRLQTAVNRRSKLPGEGLEQLLFTGALPRDNKGRPILSKASNYDLLRTMGLGDSTRLRAKTLQVLPVQILSAQTDPALKPKDFTLYPELLTPGWGFKMTMRLELTLLLAEHGPDRLGLHDRRGWVLEFAKYCRLAAGHILEQDLAFYSHHHSHGLAHWCEQRLAELETMERNECILPLGWGTGYDAKTATDLFPPELFGQVLESYRNTRRLGRPSGRGDWLGPDLSPKTRRMTLWREEEVPLGWVKLRA